MLKTTRFIYTTAGIVPAAVAIVCYSERQKTRQVNFSQLMASQRSELMGPTFTKSFLRLTALTLKFTLWGKTTCTLKRGHVLV
jgi:hypothetical protein